MNTKTVLFVIVAICYPLGEYLQNYQPSTYQFLRHHLSDFGFAPYHAMKAVILWMIIDKMMPGKLPSWIRAGLITSLGFAFIAELTHNPDWVDMVCYITGFIIGFWATFQKALDYKNSGTPTRLEIKTQVNRKTKKKRPRNR